MKKLYKFEQSPLYRIGRKKDLAKFLGVSVSQLKSLQSDEKYWIKELDTDEDYINYVLFSFTGGLLLDFIGPENLQEVYEEILKKGEERMKWYLATKYREVNDVLEFENEEDLTLCIWQLQENFPDMQMAVAYGVEDK